MSDQGDEFAFSLDLEAQDAEAVFGVMEGDALDQTGQALMFAGGFLRNSWLSGTCD